METNIAIADPAHQDSAAPAPAAGPAALRRELADAIADAAAASKAAGAAAAIAARAEAAKADAAREAERLRQDLDRARAGAVQAHAEACTEAFRAGTAPPAAMALPDLNSAPLAAALANLDALHRSAGELATEANRAAEAAGAAAARVAGIADEIVFAELHELAREAIAAIQWHWALVDRLKGLILLDEARPGGPRLRGFQEAFIARIDRQRAATARDPRMLERQNYNGFINGLAEEQQRRWLDYKRRLLDSANAVFEEPDRQQ